MACVGKYEEYVYLFEFAGHVEMKILRMNDYKFELFTKYCRKEKRRKEKEINAVGIFTIQFFQDLLN